MNEYDAEYHTRKTYDSIKSRCGLHSYVPVSWTNYQRIGVEMCERWKTSYKNFVQDMGLRPSKLMTLDRIDNSLGYFKDNCRWASYFVQHYNKAKKPRNYYYDKLNDKWLVAFQIDGKTINMGRFVDEATAKKVAKGTHRLIDRFIEVGLIN